MPVPTEDEIRDAAARLGLADENGNYPQRDRARIAAAIMQADQELTADADPANWTTARQLDEFRNELSAKGFNGPEIVGPVLLEAARHLLRSQGLRLEPREETTP
ncbi:hypothetical protein [Nocardia sp. CA-145437]|uniref:hypothetical protein n=1 Tax=Nocardia sp. CA-145437 TaxID=3239980 RepID=UPI003D9595AC